MLLLQSKEINKEKEKEFNEQKCSLSAAYKTKMGQLTQPSLTKENKTGLEDTQVSPPI